jgi:hypothetical protein
MYLKSSWNIKGYDKNHLHVRLIQFIRSLFNNTVGNSVATISVFAWREWAKPTWDLMKIVSQRRFKIELPRMQVTNIAQTYCNGSNNVIPTHLIRKLTYTFNKVLVRFPLSSNQLPHNWNHLEGVLIIHPTTYTFGQETIIGLECLNYSKYINIFHV